MQIPPLAGSRDSTSSGTLRGWSHSARALECEKMTGACAASRAAVIVAGATCDRSTSMPRRCISRTTSRPKAVSPPAAGSSVAESAHGTLRLWVSVRYRTPSWYSVRRTGSDEAMECPPSAPIRHATLPDGHGRLRRGGRPRELQRVGVAGDQLADQVNLLDGRRQRGVARQLGRDVHRPELAADPARPQPGQVGVGEVDRAGDVGRPRRPRRARLAQRPRQVVVPVHDRELAEQLARGPAPVRGGWTHSAQASGKMAA